MGDVTVTINQYVIDGLKKEVFERARVGMERGALLVNENHIKPNTPKKTGNLRDHNQYEIEANEGALTLSVKFYNPVEYDPYVHDGTAKMPGRPYRDIGIHEGQDDFFDAIQDEIK